VPEKYGNWNSIYRRFRRWSASGVWESVAIALAETMAESGHYNIDSTTVRAHVSAADGSGKPENPKFRDNGHPLPLPLKWGVTFPARVWLYLQTVHGLRGIAVPTVGREVVNACWKFDGRICVPVMANGPADKGRGRS
jgi:hypothetical protein